MYDNITVVTQWLHKLDQISMTLIVKYLTSPANENQLCSRDNTVADDPSAEPSIILYLLNCEEDTN